MYKPSVPSTKPKFIVPRENGVHQHTLSRACVKSDNEQDLKPPPLPPIVKPEQNKSLETEDLLEGSSAIFRSSDQFPSPLKCKPKYAHVHFEQIQQNKKEEPPSIPIVVRTNTKINQLKRELEAKCKLFEEAHSVKPINRIPTFRPTLSHTTLENEIMSNRSTFANSKPNHVAIQNDETLGYEKIWQFSSNRHKNAMDKEPDDSLKLKNQDIGENLHIINKLDVLLQTKKVVAVKPTPRPLIKEPKIHKVHMSDVSPELAFLIKDWKKGELNYIAQLEHALKLSSQLKEDNVPQLGYKFFGLLDEIHSFHKETFLKNLENNIETPKYFVLCFITHHRKFNIYIRRQWLIPQESELDSFEYYLLKRYNLEPYLSLTTRRVYDYGKNLQLFKSICQKQNNIECKVAVDEAIKIIANVQHQLEKVDFLKIAFGSFSNKLKECGQVLLDGTFGVSINGSKNKKCVVYICENLVIFANPQDEGCYQYIDSMPTSETYCNIMAKSKNKFEIGLRGRKNFILISEYKEIKDHWCKELRKVIKYELYEG